MILKPCPFCGSLSMAVKYGRRRSRVVCKCGAKGPSVATGASRPADHIIDQAAALEWNRREPQQ